MLSAMCIIHLCKKIAECSSLKHMFWSAEAPSKSPWSHPCLAILFLLSFLTCKVEEQQLVTSMKLIELCKVLGNLVMVKWKTDWQISWVRKWGVGFGLWEEILESLKKMKFQVVKLYEITEEGKADRKNKHSRDWVLGVKRGRKNPYLQVIQVWKLTFILSIHVTTWKFD